MKTLICICFVILFFTACKKHDKTPFIQVQSAELINIPADSVKLNDSGYAPLSALINFSYKTPGKTKIIVMGKHGENSNIEHEFDDFDTMHSVPVIGLYGDYNNTVEIVVFDANNDSLAKAFVNIQTGPLPDNLPVAISVDSADYSALEPGLNLVSNFNSNDPFKPYMVDNYGDIRWVLDYSAHPVLKNLYYDVGLKRLRNGNFYFADANSSHIYEVDLLGNIVNTWGLSGYTFHHEVTEKPDGNFIVCATLPSSTHTNGSPTIEDYLIEVERQTGNVIHTWDLKESLDEYRTALIADSKDWLHTNAVLYDTTDNTIIISARKQGVMKLDYDNNVKWILAPHKGWGMNRRGEDLNQFLLTPLDANGAPITDTTIVNGNINAPDFEWCWFQHCPIFMPNGNLLVFDNGTVRNYNASLPKYSRAVEYKIDEVNKTVQQVWEYGKERGIETYSAVVSSVQYLPESNHILFSPGYHVLNQAGEGGKIVEVDYATRKALLQISISVANKWGFHRANRISAYP